MSAPARPPTSRVDLYRRDTEIAAAVVRTIFLLIVVFSSQFLHARGVRGTLLIVTTILATLYNLGLFIRHMQRLPFPRFIIVIVDTFLISLWIYFAGEAGEQFFPIYFAVVVMAGLWFRGGGPLVVALLASLLYLGATSYSSPSSRPPPEAMLQVPLLLLTSALVTIATRVQEREREELVLSRAALEQHRQRIRIAQHVDELVRPRRIPVTPGLDIAFRFRPAGYGISGDYYDVITLGGRCWGIVVADARAKEELGLVYLPVFKSALRLAARRENSPAAVLTHANREVATEMEERSELEAFIGMSYTMIDLDQGSLVHANAGMEPGVVIRAPDQEMISFHTRGIVLGVVPDATYQEETLAIRTGDTLVLFSDGMTEALDRSDHVLGRDGLIARIRANLGAPTADALAQRVFEYVVEYARDSRRRDDSTLLVVRVTGTDIGPHPEPSAV